MLQIRLSLAIAAALLTACTTSNIGFPGTETDKASLLTSGGNSKSSVTKSLLSQTPSLQASDKSVTAPPVVSALPQYFIANNGQLDSKVHYYSKQRGQSIYFTVEGVHFVLRRAEKARRQKLERL